MNAIPAARPLTAGKGSDARGGERLQLIATTLLLALTAMVVYLPTMGYDLVAYDDFDYISNNLHVQNGLTGESVRWAFTTGHSSNWHPLTWLSLMLDLQWFGHKAAGLHLTNVLLHGANAALLFLLLRRLTGAHWRSGLVAGLFALHPLHVESVAWVAERKDVLSTFFGLLALTCYAKYAGRRQGTSNIQHPTLNIQYWAALLLYTLSLLSKPMLVTLPFVMLLLDYWPLGRFTIDDLRFTRTREVSSPVTRHPSLFWEKIPFFLLSAGSAVVTFLVQRHGGAVQPADVFPIGARIGNALVAYVSYLGQAFWPANLAILYPHPGRWPMLVVAASAGLLLGLSLLAVRWRKRWPFVPVGWFWFLGTLVPVIGLIQVGLQARADRYTYVPLIGIFIVLAWGLGEIATRWRLPKGAVQGIGFACVWACAVQTAGQLGHWRNSETLFRHALAITTNNYVAKNDLGYFLFTRGRTDEAVTLYREALAIKPDYADALNNLGHALVAKKELTNAMDYYAAALRANPGHAEARNNLGIVLDELGRLDEASAQYRIVLELQPDHPTAHGNLAITLTKKGELDEAIQHFRWAVRLNPKSAYAHNNLGGALAVKRDFAAASEEYAAALRLDPDYGDAHKNLGFALVELQRPQEAAQHLHEALRLQPENQEARAKLRELEGK